MKKIYLIVIGILLLSLITISAKILAIMIQGEKDLKKQEFFYQIEQTSPNDDIGLTTVELFSVDKSEIEFIIQKVFDYQWNYFYDREEKLLDRQYIKDLYLPEGYQPVKEQLKNRLAENYNDVGTQNQYGYRNYNSSDISRFFQETKFSKPRKYKNLDNRVGIMAGFYDGKTYKSDIQYFLFRKMDNQWKIEKEVMPDLGYLYGLPDKEIAIIKELKNPSNATKGYKDCISRWPSDLCKMFISEERAKLYAICAQIEIPKRELDTGVYPENKIARISWWDGKLQQNVTLYLPYEPEIEFNGCSETAKATLRDVQTNIINQ